MSHQQNLPLKTENVDMDSFFDFNQGTTPVATSSKMDNGWSSYDQSEEHQQFNGPSHDYNQYKQQVGLPSGSVSNVPAQSMMDGYNSGLGDMSFDGSWSTGIDMDADMSMDFNNLESSASAMFFPPPNGNAQVDTFINPTNLAGEEPVSNVGRLWPGMHSQQAAMQKAAQTQVVQQRQMKPQFQQAQQHHRQPSVSASQSTQSSSQANGKRPVQMTDPQVEERISRLLSQMRHNSSANDDESGSPSDLLPHVARMKKDEEEMDEDERLLASDEGKKLSSKERRQLRNKVSARAFRSRRKEYITQLEGEVALKAQENVTLRNENDSLIQENERYRGFIETILRHPAFGPFMNDLSKNPSMLGLSQQQPQTAPQSTPHQQQQQQQQQQQNSAQQSQQQTQTSQQQLSEDSKPSFLNFDASQLQIPAQQSQQTERVGIATVPENDFSKLNINGFQATNFNDFRSVNAFAVTDLPTPELSTLLIDATADSYFASVDSHTDVFAPSAQNNAGLDLLLAKLDRAASRTRT